jgi:transposase
LAGYAGLMQADAYPGFNRLYEANRKPAPIVEVACWAHARGASSSTWPGSTKRRSQARLCVHPRAVCIEREINGLAPPERVSVRKERSRRLIFELEGWLCEQPVRVSKNSETGNAIDYSRKRRSALTRFLDDGRLYMWNNAAERELRGIAVGRRNWTFAGSDEGGRRAPIIYMLIATAELNDVDPQAWLADMLARLPDHPAKRIQVFCPGIGAHRTSLLRPRNTGTTESSHGLHSMTSLANILPGSFAVTLPISGTQNAVPTPQPGFQNQTGRLFRAAPFPLLGSTITSARA